MLINRKLSKDHLYKIVISTILSCTISLVSFGQTSKQYLLTQETLSKGWGTYNTNSVLSHVLLPYGLALNLGVKSTDISVNGYLKDAFISSRDSRPEVVYPGNHAIDGSYSELTILWNNIRFKVQSAVNSKNDIVLLLSPLETFKGQFNAVLEVGMLWNQEGRVTKQHQSITADLNGSTIRVNAIGEQVDEHIATTSSYLSLKFNKPIAFYTGATKSLDEVKTIISLKNDSLNNYFSKSEKSAETVKAINNVIAWNTIYDHSQDRVISPVSRLWSQIFGGSSVLFCWDTYFVSYMASRFDKNLAYANAIEITKSITPEGFVPNWAGSYKKASFDRSQPPVGSMVFKELYRKFGEKWILEEVFEDLLKWNRWWETNRDKDGFLCWGSDKVKPPYEGDAASNEWQGAAYESGLDNSPMFDDIPFNKETNLLELADVGLMSLYIMDCQALAEIALILNKTNIYKELKAREKKYTKNINRLWNEEKGMYMNMRTDTRQFSTRLSPTNFYPLIAKIPNKYQVQRMVNGYLLNENEFNGDYVIPSISKSDPAYRDQKYWRGRIWGPMNFLVYLGLLNYEIPQVQQMFSEKSKNLFMENVKQNGWVFENYNGITGNITDQAEGRREGDNYYHWGALLGFISLIQNGEVANPTKPLNK